LKPEAEGDCIYHAISIALTGKGSLLSAIRFATVAKMIKFKVSLEARVMRRFDERSRTIYSG
jgi:hypothetical protein